MKKSPVRRALIVLLTLVFIGSTAVAVHKLIQYRQGDQAYDEAKELAHLTDQSQEEAPPPATVPTEYTPEDTGPEIDYAAIERARAYAQPYLAALGDIDLAPLQEVNGDVLGWIMIPDTDLSYPLLQGEDNDYYLNHTWNKTRNSAGSIFLECQISRDLTDFNTIIYGHRMGNSTMFGSLAGYEDQDYWAQHPYFFITDQAGIHVYEIFSAYVANVTDRTYQIAFSSEEYKEAFLYFSRHKSVLDTGVVPTVNDRIATLSTCVDLVPGRSTRWVVQGVERLVIEHDAGAGTAS